MIKTDKVIYRTRTLGEYNWLMTELDEVGCRWNEGGQPRPGRVLFGDFLSDTCIRLENKKIYYMYFAFYNSNPDFKDYEIIEVSDLMEDEEETEILDKLEDLKDIENEFENLVEQEEETDAQEKLDAINKQINEQIEDLRKQGKEPKAVEYTIKVCFE